MSEDDITLIYLVKGSLGGAARRRNLNEAQRTGLACLVCRGTDALTTNVGWVDDSRSRSTPTTSNSGAPARPRTETTP